MLILLALLSQWDAQKRTCCERCTRQGRIISKTPRPHEKNTLSRSRHIGNNGWFFHKLIVGLVEITFPPFLVLIKWIHVTVYRQEVRGDIITGLGANKRAAVDYQCAQVKGLGVSRWPLISVETLRRSLTDLTAQGKKLCD